MNSGKEQFNVANQIEKIVYLRLTFHRRKLISPILLTHHRPRHLPRLVRLDLLKAAIHICVYIVLEGGCR